MMRATGLGGPAACRGAVLAIALALAGGLLAPLSGAAQSCTPRPPVQVQAAPGGQVTVTATTPITQLQILADPQGAARVVLQGADPSASLPLPQTVAPHATSYTFALRGLHPTQPVTAPLRVTDACGVWESFAGAGPGLVHVALPTWTPTPTVTPTAPPPPTPTPRPIAQPPTATPLAAPVVGVGPGQVYQGARVAFAWAGRQSPRVDDYVAPVHANGALAGPPIYTSSCGLAPGATPKSQGYCAVELSPTFPTGSYYVRLIAQSTNSVLGVAPTPLEVQAAGSAGWGKGQAWGTAAQWDIEEINLAGGYLGVFAFLTAGDPANLVEGTSFHHLGLADFGLLGENFVEAGSARTCVGLICTSWPYMSWRDHLGGFRQAVWDGSAGFPDVPLHTTRATVYKYAVYETEATRWTADYCDQRGYCCPLWMTGPPCAGAGGTEPITLRTRFPWVFYGSETADPATPAGVTTVNLPHYCCPVLLTTWRQLDCWHHRWIVYDAARINARVTGCIPKQGWYTESHYR